MGEWLLEFDRAAREVPDDTFDAAKSTAELISATMGVASKVSKAVQVSKGAEEADSLWGLFNTMNNFATGIAEGDMEKVSDATLDVTIQVMELTLAGAAKTAYAAASASRKLAQDLGTHCGTADRLKELEDQEKETERELDDVERRLYEVCGQKKSPKKQPSTPSEPAPSAKPAPAPQPSPTAKPTTPKTEPPKSQSQEPAEPKSGKTQTGTRGEKPPVSPPTKPVGGAAGLPLNCGCDSRKYNAWGSSGKSLIKLADDLRGAGQCAEVLESSILAGFQNDLDLLSSALKDVSGARSLPKQEMQAKFKEVLTKTNGLPARLEKFSEQAALYRSSLEGCGQASKQAGELIRKGAAETGAEMVRK